MADPVDEEEARTEQKKRNMDEQVNQMKVEVSATREVFQQWQQLLKQLIEDLTSKRFLINALECKCQSSRDELGRKETQVEHHIALARKAHQSSWNTELKLRELELSIARQQLKTLEPEPYAKKKIWPQLIKDQEIRTKSNAKLDKKRKLLQEIVTTIQIKKQECLQQQQICAAIQSEIEATRNEYSELEERISKTGEKVVSLENQLKFQQYHVEQQVRLSFDLEEKLVLIKLEKIRRKRSELLKGEQSLHHIR